MTDDPKKLPPWLRKKQQSQAPEEPPPEDAAPDLPPWLREDAVAPKVKRVSPPNPDEQQGELPPWLKGMAEPPKSYTVGGTELSEEYLAGGDELPDSLDSDLTYNSWMAEQVESKREKDIEEEVPDLLSSILPDEPAEPQPKQTGQLPDWFLGLEELDTTDAPDWFSAEQTPPAAPEQMPSWINDMVEEEPEPEEEPADEIGSFFDSLGGAPPGVEEEETPEMDWFEQPSNDLPAVPDEDFFTHLVGGSGSSTPEANSVEPPPPSPAPQYDLPDIDDFEEDGGAQAPAVEIPQNELDAFFDDLAAGRAASLDDIEDPDMDWIVEQPTAEPGEEPEGAPPPVANSADTLNWLSELNNIVSSATRTLQQPPDDDVPAEVAKLWNAPPVEPEPEPEPEVYDWDEVEPADPVEADAEIEEPDEGEWLESITPDDEIEISEPSKPPSRSMLSARLLRQSAPPPPEPPEETPSAETPFDETPPEEAPLIPEDELQSGWLRDDLFAEEPSTETADNNDFFSQLEANTNSNLLPETNQIADEERDAALADADLMSELDFGEDGASDDFYASLGMSDDQPDEEVETPETDDFYASLGMSDDQQSEEVETPETDDFYASLGMSDDQPDEEAEETPETNDFYASLDMSDDQPDEVEETPETDDFYASLGMSDDQQSEEAETPETDDFYASLDMSDDQPDEVEETPETDDFYASLGMSDDQQSEEAETPESDDFYASLGMSDDQQSEEAETPETDDFYASLGMSDDQQNEEVETPQTDDFYASLGMSDDQQSEEAEETPETDDFYASLGMSDDQPDEEAEETPETDDFYASLNLGDDQPDEEAEETPETDGFYASLGMSDDQPDEEAEETPETDDFYASLGMSDDQPDEEAEETPETDDFYASLGMSDDQPDDETELPQTDDFFASLGIEDEEEAPPATSEEGLFGQWGDDEEADETELPQTDDFFASLGIEDEEEAPPATSEEGLFGQWGDDEEAEAEAPAQEADPYREWDSQKEMPPDDDFFSALGLIGDEQPTEEAPVSEIEEPTEEDFFKSLGMIDDQAPADQPTYGDVDSYLASLGVDQPEVTPTTDDLFRQAGPVDLDALFAAPMMPEAPEQAPEAPSIPAANEDWLAQLEASVGEVSASAMVRQREDRPVEELPDRLRKLRQRAEQLPDAPQEDQDAPPLGVTNTLTATPFVGEDVQAPAGGVVLTPEQQRKVELLKALVPVDDRPQPFRLSAIEATYNSPFMPDLEDTPESIVVPEKPSQAPARPRTRRRRRVQIRIDRFLVAALLAAAVILPFILPSFRIGSLPPSGFAQGSAAQTAFNQIDALKPGDLALVAVEYSPTSAAELDSMTDALVRHILMRAAFPVLISSNPIGLLRSEDLLNAISGDSDFLKRIGASALTANQDYYIVHYLPGSVIGLRAFSQDTANLLLTDIRGQATNLHVRSLSDFALVTVITDRADTLRAYAEQVTPLTRAPLLAAVSYSADPLAEPYIQARSGGLLVGYRDAYTYQTLLDTVSARAIAQRVRIVPTDTATPTPQPTTVPPAAAATEAATAESTESTTRVPTATELPRSAVVIASPSANMRGGPGTNNPVIAGVPSGATVTVIGFNADQSWVNVRLDDGQEGWIAATLLRIQQSLPKPRPHVRQRIDEGTTPTPTLTPVNSTATTVESTAEVGAPAATKSAPNSTETVAAPTATFTPTKTRTPTPTQTSTATATPTPTATATEVVIAGGLPPHSPDYRDERWYAMNLGIIASAIIISFGAVFNVGRGLLRRGRRG